MALYGDAFLFANLYNDNEYAGDDDDCHDDYDADNDDNHDDDPDDYDDDNNEDNNVDPDDHYRFSSSWCEGGHQSSALMMITMITTDDHRSHDDYDGDYDDDCDDNHNGDNDYNHACTMIITDYHVTMTTITIMMMTKKMTTVITRDCHHPGVKVVINQLHDCISLPLGHTIKIT